MLRQTATLAVSTPSAGETCGRRGVAERELDTGTTTTSSSSMPVSNSSTETMTAGRCLPGSPLRAAPRATSQTSPRRGLGDAVIDRVVPIAILVADGVGSCFGAGGFAFGAEDRLTLSVRRQLGEQGRDRHSAFAGLGGEAVTCLNGNPDRCRLVRHIGSLLLASEAHSLVVEQPHRGEREWA